MPAEPIPMLIWCPMCRARHIDEGEFASRPHHSHACQSCGHVWRPALVATVGVPFLPGFRNAPAPPAAPKPVKPEPTPEELAPDCANPRDPMCACPACQAAAEKENDDARTT